MSKALFFNALPNEESVTGYDRNYNADDLSDFLSIVCDTGVVKTNNDTSGNPQGLKVVIADGRVVNVNAGKAVIKGKAFINEALESFTVEPNGTTSARYDYIVVKYDNNVNARTITLELRTGTSSVPTASVLAQNNARYNVHELMLAYIKVEPSASTVTVYDTRGNAELCPWFTAVKGYEDYYDAIIQTHEFVYTMPSAGNKVITTLPSKLYNEKYSLIDVYTNGIKEHRTAYTASLEGGYIVITFKAQKTTGAKITVNLDNFIDGEGMGTVNAQYTRLISDVETLKTIYEYNYICNGVNDNEVISELAQEFAENSLLPSKAQLTINVYGTLGIASPNAGDGSTANRYQWFNIGTGVASDKRVIVDFAHCGIINVPLMGSTSNVIFAGYNTQVKNARVIANCAQSACTVFIFASNNGDIKAENCYFESLVTGEVCLTYTGTFINCEAYLSSDTTHAFCFFLVSNSKPTVVIGGRYRAYTANLTAGYSSTIAQSNSSEEKAAIVMYGVNAPTVAREGYAQKSAVSINNGYITTVGLITALPITVASLAKQSMTGTIPLSK